MSMTWLRVSPVLHCKVTRGELKNVIMTHHSGHRTCHHAFSNMTSLIGLIEHKVAVSRITPTDIEAPADRECLSHSSFQAQLCLPLHQEHVRAPRTAPPLQLKLQREQTHRAVPDGPLTGSQAQATGDLLVSRLAVGCERSNAQLPLAHRRSAHPSLLSPEASSKRPPRFARYQASQELCPGLARQLASRAPQARLGESHSSAWATLF